MTRLIFILSVVALTAATSFGYTQGTMRDKVTKKIFPKTVTVNYEGKDHRLEATGLTTRKKYFVKIYSIASYIEDPNSLPEGNVYQEILESDKPKQLNIIWVRNVSQKRVQEGFKESLDIVMTKSEQSELKADVDKYLSFIGNVVDNDEYILQWLPNGTVNVEINGQKKGSIESPAFAKALWGIWFGGRTGVDRKRLVSDLR